MQTKENRHASGKGSEVQIWEIHKCRLGSIDLHGEGIHNCRHGSID